jgi:hypothetical protein
MRLPWFSGSACHVRVNGGGGQRQLRARAKRQHRAVAQEVSAFLTNDRKLPTVPYIRSLQLAFYIRS